MVTHPSKGSVRLEPNSRRLYQSLTVWALLTVHDNCKDQQWIQDSVPLLYLGDLEFTGRYNPLFPRCNSPIFPFDTSSDQAYLEYR